MSAEAVADAVRASHRGGVLSAEAAPRRSGVLGAEVVRVSPEWLRRREPADADARSGELAGRLGRHFAEAGPRVIHDLGGGGGAMGRWLAPLLPGPQHWVVHDRDEDLLELAVADVPEAAGGGARVTVEGRPSDIARLTRSDLAGAGLVTASALLDLLTADELVRILGVCSGLPMLLTLSVAGRVTLTPEEPLDARIREAFNAHQRRGGKLGPDAVALALDELGRTGAQIIGRQSHPPRAAAPEVMVRPSPWRLGAAHADLAAEWLDGWVAAACEQEPALAEEAGEYRDRRMAQAAAGALEVMVDHADLLVLP
jgi:hypothetical protein